MIRGSSTSPRLASGGRRNMLGVDSAGRIVNEGLLAYLLDLLVRAVKAVMAVAS